MQRYAVVLVVVVLAAACGGGETSEGTPEPTASPTTSETTAATTTTALAADAPELGGTSWNVTDYTLPNGSLTNVWKTEVTIAFAADGTLSGSAGCNEYFGTWEVSGPYDAFESGVPDPNDGQELTLAELAWTERACENPDVMQQEAEILDLLQQAGRWVLIREKLHLRDASGSYLFEAESV
jgi:heat shock protein HslJ